MIKIQWLASIWRQNDQKCWVTSQNIQNNAKLQNRSNYIELHRLDGKTIKTKLNYKSDQNPMTCIDLRSKRSKCRVTSRNIQNNAKLQNRSNYNELHRLDVKTIKQRKTTKVIKLQWLACINVKTFKTTENYKTDQITLNCIDLTSKRSKQRKTTKVIKIQWLASIWRQNDQNKAKLQKWSKSNDLHLFDVKTIKNVQLRRKTFKTTQNYKTNQITLNCIDWMVKRSKQS